MKAWKKLLLGLILMCVWVMLPVFPPCCWLPFAVQSLLVIIGAGLIILIIARL